MTWEAFLKSRWATVALSGALIFVMIITAKILVQKSVVDKEIAKLQNQMDRVKNDNEKLSSLVQYLNTPEYQEQQAREKLNLSKNGEHVVVLPQDNVAAATTSSVVAVSNVKLWYNYFFNHEN